MGTLSGKLTGYGIDDDFIRSIANSLQPDSSALFVLVRKVQPEKVLRELTHFKGRVIRSPLSPEAVIVISNDLCPAEQNRYQPD